MSERRAFTVKARGSGRPDYSKATLGPAIPGSRYERRTIILNDPEITTGAPPSNRSADDYGKFFPRGMRGTIEEIRLYAYRTAAGTITLNISPYPGVGPTYSKVITPGLAWGWVDAAFNVMWNYDSMYVWISGCLGAVFWGYDAEKPYDGHLTDVFGATFTAVDERPFIRVVITGETAGDVPVSGTVNIIEIPSVASQVATELRVALPNMTSTIVCEADGAGTVLQAELIFHTAVVPTATIFYILQIYADGVLAFLVFNMELTQSYVATSGRSSAGEFVQISWGADHQTRMMVRLPIKFRRHIRLMAYQNTGAATTVDGSIYANMIR